MLCVKSKIIYQYFLCSKTPNGCKREPFNSTYIFLTYMYTYVKLRENFASNLSIESLFMCLTLHEIPVILNKVDIIKKLVR